MVEREAHVVVDIAAKIRAIPDFPKKGILFRDIMPLLQDAEALRYTVDKLAEYAVGKNVELIVGAESRGFILGAAMAYKLGVGFAPARKPGKLPWKTVSAEYALEYGADSLEMHEDAVRPGMRVLIHDDLLATGGTAKAKCELVERLGGVVMGLAFIVELVDLGGRGKLAGYDVFSLVKY